MNKVVTTILFSFLLLPVFIFGQGSIKGTVTDLQSGEPLIGANVLVVGTTSGSATDIDGNYVIRNLQAGTYEVRASYIGYQTITVTDVRVTTDLTTELNFQLPSEGITVDEVEVIAERPLIQKDNTNAIRTTTSEDIEALPVRGVNNIVSTLAGVVVEAGNIFVRGGRVDEVGYYLEGVSIKNPVAGGRAVTIPQDALEEIQVQAGGYTAEFGGANSGIIRQQLKTGGSQYKASFEYVTDNIGFQSKDEAFSGEEILGSHWYGYNVMSAILSGPIIDERFKFFLNFNYEYNRDLAPQPYPGINIGKIVDPLSNDSINLVYPAGAVRNNSQDIYSYAGTFTLDFKPVILRLTGTFSDTRQDLINTSESGNFTPVLSFLNPRKGIRDIMDGAFSAKITHVVSDNLFYELSGGYFLQKREDYDPYLKDDFWNYGDSVANANAGWVWERSVKDISGDNTGRYVTPSIRNIMGFAFNGYGEVPVSYGKRDRTSYSANADVTFFAGDHHTFKLGGEFQQYTIRHWSVGGQDDLAQLLDAQLTGNPGADESAIRRSILINQGVNNFGYDVFGNKVDEGFFFAPHKPVFASGYIQDKIEFEDIIINAGLRYDFIDVDNLQMVDPSYPDASIDPTSGELKEAGWEEVETFSAVSPRLGISFPVTDRTVFHAQFGKFVQQTRLADIYDGYYRTGFEIKGGFFIPNPVGKNVRPTRTTQYEIGFTQLLTDFLSFDITAYYKDIRDQVVFYSQQVASNSAFQAYSSLQNGDFATTKGLEITLNMRRYERVLLNAQLSLQNAQGTGSFPNSNRGIVGAPIDGVTVFEPVYISPLSFNNAVKGAVNVDYRFGANDGPAALHNFGVSVLATFSSGHPFTRGIGGTDLEGEARSRQPIEPLNSSSTPSTFQVDLRIDKTFNIIDRLGATIYVQVINLFDALNVQNVFLRTGSAQDDGFISNPELEAQLIETYGDQYVDLYNAVYIDYYERYQNANTSNFGGLNPLFFGPPRQIRLGIKLAY